MNADQKSIPEEEVAEPTPQTLKQHWEEKYEQQLKVAEDQIAKDLVSFKSNIKVIRAMNEDEFLEWFKRYGYPQPLFDMVNNIFKAMKAEDERKAAEKEKELAEAKKKALTDQADDVEKTTEEQLDKDPEKK